MNVFTYFFIAITLLACNRRMSTEASSSASASAVTPIATSSANEEKIPACILQKIETIKKEPVWNPPAEIYEYEYDGKKVYAISSNCCDFFNTVVDSDCNYVCAPSGGFTGRGDGKCPQFFKEAKQVRLVWKDERTRK